MTRETAALAASALAPALLAGERLLWSGRPHAGLRLCAADAIAIPFTVMWAGFAFFWEWTAIRSGAPLFFRLWGIPFVLTGLYISVGRFFWDAYRRRRTVYGVTDRRVLFVTRGPGAAVKAIGLAGVREMVLTTGANGAGSLAFGRDGASPWCGRSSWPGGQPRIASFEGIEDVRSVQETILRAQAEAR